MALKRKINMVNKFERSDYERDDSDNVSVIKRSKMDFIADSNNSDPEAHSPSSISKYIKITGDEIRDQHDTFNFVETSGPQCSLPHDAKPIEYFNLFFNSSLWTLMVKETNRYAEDLLKLPQVSEQSRIRQWKPVTTLEMKAFVAVLLEMGKTRRPTIISYWAENSRNIPWFKQMFSRNRIQLIFKCFRLVNNQECRGKYDSCAKFNPIVEHANKMFKLYYIPHQQLTIDESLVETHSSISQYLPNRKRHHQGIKFWMLRDAASNYCTSFYYRSAKSKADQDEIKKMGLGYNVAVKLLKENDYLNKGYHIFVDDFFTSTALARYLYSRNTYLTGIIQRKMKDIPNKIKINAGEAKYFRNRQVLLCKYRERKHMKKPVCLISTHAVAQGMIVTRKRRRKTTQTTIPSIVSAYNNFMGGVNESDKMLCTYLDEHRTLKYWKKIVFNIFTRMLLNSYIIYKETAKTEIMSQFEFTSSIIVEIEREWMQEKKNQLIKNEKKTYGLLKLPGRNLRRCVVCTSKTNGIKRSNLICVQCKRGLHGLCFDKHKCENY